MLCHMYIYKADVSMFCVSVCLGRRWRGGGQRGKRKKRHSIWHERQQPVNQKREGGDYFFFFFLCSEREKKNWGWEMFLGGISAQIYPFVSRKKKKKKKTRARMNKKKRMKNCSQQWRADTHTKKKKNTINLRHYKVRNCWKEKNPVVGVGN